MKKKRSTNIKLKSEMMKVFPRSGRSPLLLTPFGEPGRRNNRRRNKRQQPWERRASQDLRRADAGTVLLLSSPS